MVAEYLHSKNTNKINMILCVFISKALINVLQNIQQKQALTQVCACFFMGLMRSGLVADYSIG